MPAIIVDFSPVPSTTNPLGIKGVGEGGTVAATPTVMNAILDALAPVGVTDVPMPATPERVWRAIHLASSPPKLFLKRRRPQPPATVRRRRRRPAYALPLAY